MTDSLIECIKEFRIKGGWQEGGTNVADRIADLIADRIGFWNYPRAATGTTEWANAWTEVITLVDEVLDE